ncbi:MAG: hypothetical protein A4E49_02694 [Methanosaeta sp. PtaU1.Bin112]|nr:MAG: hypothetical protein A4E49_02694 [Methanosaeta sp. PtaU1.Bin112]
MARSIDFFFICSGTAFKIVSSMIDLAIINLNTSRCILSIRRKSGLDGDFFPAAFGMDMLSISQLTDRFISNKNVRVS